MEHSTRTHSAFGDDAFGRGAEKTARFFGTPQYILGQSVIVVIWIALNAAAVSLRWDPYPFILLNLAFSTQAAYAAPLILLEHTRQATEKRAQDRVAAIKKETDTLGELLRSNTDLTQQDKQLTEQVHAAVQEIRAL